MIMKDLFLHIASSYEPNLTVLAPLWQELDKQYSQKKRYYHTLAHIENLLRIGHEHRPMVQDWETFVFVSGLLNKSTGNALNVDGGVATGFLR